MTPAAEPRAESQVRSSDQLGGRFFIPFSQTANQFLKWRCIRLESDFARRFRQMMRVEIPRPEFPRISKFADFCPPNQEATICLMTGEQRIASVDCIRGLPSNLTKDLAAFGDSRVHLNSRRFPQTRKNESMVTVYRAGWQAAKVRVTMIASLFVMVLCLWWGQSIARDGQSGFLAAFLASLGIAFAGGMWFFSRHYVAEIDFDPETEHVHFTTVGFVSNDHHVIGLTDFRRVQVHQNVDWGAAKAPLMIIFAWNFINLCPVPIVDAPWWSILVNGWRWPLIVDRQGTVFVSKFEKFLSGRANSRDLQIEGTQLTTQSPA